LTAKVLMILSMVERAQEADLDCFDGIENLAPSAQFQLQVVSQACFSTVFQMCRGFPIQPQFLGYIAYSRFCPCSSTGSVAEAELSDSSGHACVSLCNIF